MENCRFVTERVSTDGNYMVLVYDHIGITTEDDFMRIATALDLSEGEVKQLLDVQNIPAIAIPCAEFHFARFITEFLSENGFPAKELSYNVNLSDVDMSDEISVVAKVDEIIDCLQAIDERLNHNGIVNLATAFVERYKITGDVLKAQLYNRVVSQLDSDNEGNIITRMVSKQRKAAA